MRTFFALFILLALQAQAQDPKTYIGAFDTMIYSLKSKGVQDFVVDIESSKLKNQMNEQLIFGDIKELVFRVYWTAAPERLAIQVRGLPEGFKEVKEELKASVLAGMENLLPIGVMDKFNGHKITAGSGPREFVAQDQTGIAPISSYILKFDSRDTLVEVIGKKPVGSFKVTTKYEKLGLSDGKWALKEQVTSSEENGQTMISKKELDYGVSQGMGVLEEVTITVVQKSDSPEAKTVKVEEKLEYKNYKINSGEALKYFLGDAAKK